MKQLSEIRQEISHLMRRMEDERLEKMGAYRKGLYYTFATLGLGIILILFGLQGQFALIIIGGIVAILSLIVYYYMAQKPLNEFKQQFKSTVLKQFVQLMYPNVNYEPKGFIKQTDFNRSQLFSNSFNIYRGEDYFEGSINNIRFELSELDVKRRKHRSNSNGSSTSTTTIFDGIFVVIAFDKATYAETYVLPDSAENMLGGFGKMIQKSLGSLFQRGTMIYLDEHPEFEKQFVVYSTDEQESMRILTPTLLESIYELRNTWNARPHLSFIDNTACVAIKTRKNFFKVKPHRSLVDDQKDIIQELFDEVALVISIVESISEQGPIKER